MNEKEQINDIHTYRVFSPDFNFEIKGLTVGKTYEIIGETKQELGNNYQLLDDAGAVRSIDCSLFVKADEVNSKNYDGFVINAYKDPVFVRGEMPDIREKHAKAEKLNESGLEAITNNENGAIGNISGDLLDLPCVVPNNSLGLRKTHNELKGKNKLASSGLDLQSEVLLNNIPKDKIEVIFNDIVMEINQISFDSRQVLEKTLSLENKIKNLFSSNILAGLSENKDVDEIAIKGMSFN